MAIGVVVIPAIYTHLAAAAVAAGLAWSFQDARMDAAVAEQRLAATTYKLDVSLAQRGADARVRRAEADLNNTYQGALNAARNREALLRRELDDMRAVSDGLRDQAADAGRRLAAAAPSAIRDYALAVNSVYDDCRAAYGDMAAKAAGHATDVRTFRDAWPMIQPSRPDAGNLSQPSP
jgi:hypothetical protein